MGVVWYFINMYRYKCVYITYIFYEVSTLFSASFLVENVVNLSGDIEPDFYFQPRFYRIAGLTYLQI